MSVFWVRWKNSDSSKTEACPGVVLRALYDDTPGHTQISRWEILAFWPPPGHRSLGMAGAQWPMRTRRGRCLIFATHTASDYLPRLARAAPCARAHSVTSGPELVFPRAGGSSAAWQGLQPDVAKSPPRPRLLRASLSRRLQRGAQPWRRLPHDDAPRVLRPRPVRPHDSGAL